MARIRSTCLGRRRCSRTVVVPPRRPLIVPAQFDVPLRPTAASSRTPAARHLPALAVSLTPLAYVNSSDGRDVTRVGLSSPLASRRNRSPRSDGPGERCRRWQASWPRQVTCCSTIWSPPKWTKYCQLRAGTSSPCRLLAAAAQRFPMFRGDGQNVRRWPSWILDGLHVVRLCR